MILSILFSGVVMANETENKFDSSTGHVVVPVLHPNGETHNISVPADTSLDDLHSALLETYTHPAIESQIKQPTKEGVLEYSDAFRKAAKDAVSASRGFMGNEAGFASNAQGTPGKIQQDLGGGSDTAHHVRIVAPSDAQYTFHTHPSRTGGDEPSPEDKQNAKNLHRTIYVASQAGLFGVDPSGQVTHVFENSDWASKTPREAKKKS
jgi:hypothetical protein